MRKGSTDLVGADAGRTPVVIAARRLATAKAGGAYRGLRVHELAAPVLRAVLADAGLAGTGQHGSGPTGIGHGATAVADVILGNATGGGGNMARLAALTAGLPESIPGLTVDRQCASGLEAIVLACRLVQAGAGELYLAGGAESISTAPARAHRLAGGELEFFARAQFAPLAAGDPDAGVAAENVAIRYGVSRERQDAYAMESHRRACAAADGGAFDREILPLAGLSADQGPRRNLTPALMSRFPAAFVDGGTVTAGNSCPYSDGAAAVVVTTLERARYLADQGLVFTGSAVAGTDPQLMGVGAARSTAALLAADLVNTGAALDSGLLEFNEAFAAQVIASAELLGVDPAALNRDGGALALGHPYGASGAVLVTRLFSQALARGEEGLNAVAMVSAAGGMGVSAAFQWRTF